MPRLVCISRTRLIEDAQGNEFIDRIVEQVGSTPTPPIENEGVAKKFINLLSAMVSSAPEDRKQELERAKPVLLSILKSDYGPQALLGADIEEVDPASPTNQFLTTPDSTTIYAEHPFRKNFFIPVNLYDDYLLKEKKRDFLRLLAGLGVKSIKLSRSVEGDASAQVGAKTDLPQGVPATLESNFSSQGRGKSLFSLESDFDPPDGPPEVIDGLVWLAAEPEWQSYADLRMKGKLRRISVQFSYQCFFQAGGALIQKALRCGLLGNLNVNAQLDGSETFLAEFYCQEPAPTVKPVVPKSEKITKSRLKTKAI